MSARHRLRRRNAGTAYRPGDQFRAVDDAVVFLSEIRSPVTVPIGAPTHTVEPAPLEIEPVPAGVDALFVGHAGRMPAELMADSVTARKTTE